MTTAFDHNRNRVKSSEARSPLTAASARRFAGRCVALFGHCETTALQLAFERGHSTIEDWRGGRKVPPDIHIILELLEHTPPRKWPMRWRKLIR